MFVEVNISHFRSSSLIVPPPTPQSSTWHSPRSPGSRSLHISRETSPVHLGTQAAAAHKSLALASKGPEMFTFPPIALDQVTIQLCFLNLEFFEQIKTELLINSSSHFFQVSNLNLVYLQTLMNKTG